MVSKRNKQDWVSLVTKEWVPKTDWEDEDDRIMNEVWDNMEYDMENTHEAAWDTEQDMTQARDQNP